MNTLIRPILPPTESFLDGLQDGKRDEPADPGLRALRKRLDARKTSDDSDVSAAASKPNHDDGGTAQPDGSDDGEAGTDGDTPDGRGGADLEQSDARNRARNSNQSGTDLDSASEPSRDDAEGRRSGSTTMDSESNDEPEETSGKLPNDTPMSNDQQNLSDTDAPRDENDPKVAEDARTTVDGVDARTKALMRVALNDLSGAADEERRMRAVDTLAARGESVIEPLTRVADIDNAGNEAVAARAEEALVDILFESAVESG